MASPVEFEIIRGFKFVNMDPLVNPARSQNPKLKKKLAKHTKRANECSQTKRCMSRTCNHILL